MEGVLITRCSLENRRQGHNIIVVCKNVTQWLRYPNRNWFKGVKLHTINIRLKP